MIQRQPRGEVERLGEALERNDILRFGSWVGMEGSIIPSKSCCCRKLDVRSQRVIRIEDLVAV